MATIEQHLRALELERDTSSVLPTLRELARQPGLGPSGNFVMRNSGDYVPFVWRGRFNVTSFLPRVVVRVSRARCNA